MVALSKITVIPVRQPSFVSQLYLQFNKRHSQTSVFHPASGVCTKPGNKEISRGNKSGVLAPIAPWTDATLLNDI